MKMSSPKYLEEIIFSKSHDGWSCIVKNYSSLKFIVWWMTLKTSKFHTEKPQKNAYYVFIKLFWEKLFCLYI